MTDRQDLMVEISHEEARLAALKAEVEESRARLVALRKQLAAELPARTVLPTPLVPETASAPMTNAVKVAVFRSLFRGRKDVFPRRWENAKTGKSGYSPACVNEWEYGLCEKKKRPNAGRRATCGECPNHAFIPVTNEEIAKRLRGYRAIGYAHDEAPLGLQEIEEEAVVEYEEEVLRRFEEQEA